MGKPSFHRKILLFREDKELALLNEDDLVGKDSNSAEYE